MNEPQTIEIDGQTYWYVHHKAPFRQLPGALRGYPIGVPVVDGIGKMLCPFCRPARTFHTLTRHVNIHGFANGRAFKDAVGWMSSTSLNSQAMTNKQRATWEATGTFAARMVRITAMSAVGRARAAEARAGGAVGRGPGTGRGRPESGRSSPEFKNKSGRCPDQIARVARLLHRQKHLDSVHLVAEGIPREAVVREFGSMEAFRKRFGWDGGRRYTDAEMIVSVLELARRLGRTPTVRDLRGWEPGTHALVMRFGSLTAVMTRAGLDPNLQSPGGSPANGPVAILRAFAATGSIERTAQLIGSGTRTVQAALDQFGYPFPPFSKDPGRRAWAAEMAGRVS